MLDYFKDRVKAKFISEDEAQKRMRVLKIELRGRGIKFKIQHFAEDGGYYVAKSVDYPKGAIITSGKTIDELDKNIKDAIFTAFEIPKQYCDPTAIVQEGEERSIVYATR